MKILENIKRIRVEKHLSQETLAAGLGCDVATFNRIENGKRDLRFSEFEKIANLLHVREIDIITYPEVFIQKTKQDDDRVSVTFEVSPDNRDILISMINKRTIDNPMVNQTY